MNAMNRWITVFLTFLLLCGLASAINPGHVRPAESLVIPDGEANRYRPVSDMSSDDRRGTFPPHGEGLVATHAYTQTFTIPLDAESGWVGQGGGIGPQLTVGDVVLLNRGVRAFMSFDLTPLAGEIVAQAMLDLSENGTLGDPFNDLGSLLIYNYQYGERAPLASDYDAVPGAQVGTFISPTIQADVTDLLRSLVDSGESRFQIRLQFQNETDNGNDQDRLYWTVVESVTLSIALGCDVYVPVAMQSSDGEAPTPTPTTVAPPPDVTMLDNFEGDLRAGDPDNDVEGWWLYPGEGDQGTFEIDRTRGANGTSSSLRVHVTQGDIYLYYWYPPRDRGIPQAAGANRMMFYILFPANYPVVTQSWPWHNMEIGTYLYPENYPATHYYHFVNNKGSSGWQLVILPNNPSLQCENPGWDPPRIDDYYDRFLRWYIDGYGGDWGLSPPTPFDLWIDEVGFFHEAERQTCTYQGPEDVYQYNGFVCSAGETCTGVSLGGCCIQGGCVR